MKSHSKIVGNVTDYQQQEFWSNREEPHLGQVLSHRLTGRNHSSLGGSFESSTDTKESFHTWGKFWVISWQEGIIPHLGQVLSHQLTGRNHSTPGGSFESSADRKESFHTWGKFWVISWQEGIIPHLGEVLTPQQLEGATAHLGEVLTPQLTGRSHGTLRGSSYSSANWKEPRHT